MLNIEIVLDQVGSAVTEPIPPWLYAELGVRGGREGDREYGIVLRHTFRRLILEIVGRVLSRENGAVRDRKAAANRRPVMREHVIGEAHSRIQIPPGRIRLVDVGDIHETSP